MARKQLQKAILAAVVLQAAILEHHFTTAGRNDDDATIHVTNKLSSKVTLILHCRSKDDDLGARALDAGATFSLSLSPNYFGGTLFWCKAAVRDKRLALTAFDEDDHGTYVKDFDVSDDGVGGVDTYHGNWLHICGWS